MTRRRAFDEVLALFRSLWFAEGNSNARKLAMLVLLLLFSANAVLVMIGRANLSDPNALALWSFLLSGFSFLWGQNARDEVRRRRRRRGETDDE